MSMKIETINIAGGEVSLWCKCTIQQRNWPHAVKRDWEFEVNPSEGTILFYDDLRSHELDINENKWLANRLLNRATKDMAADWHRFNGGWKYYGKGDTVLATLTLNQYKPERWKMSIKGVDYESVICAPLYEAKLNVEHEVRKGESKNV